MAHGWNTTLISPSKENGRNNHSNDSSLDSFTVLNDWDVRMFYCMGESHGNQVTFHTNSYLKKSDLAILDDEVCDAYLINDFECLHLFGFSHDKGSALMNDMNNLFKMAKQSYGQLEIGAMTSIDGFTTNSLNLKTCNYLHHREEIVRFLIYLRNYIRRIGLYSKYKWMTEYFFTQIELELRLFSELCSSTTYLSDYIIKYSANSLGNKCIHPSYHLFHCQLDMKWMYITLLYQLIVYKKKQTDDACSQDANTLTFESLQNVIHTVTSDLIILALKRFQDTDICDLNGKCMFSCTCVRELWKLLQLCTDLLHSKQRLDPFWTYVNQLCNEILGKSDSKELLRYNCQNPAVFTLWILKNLVKLYKSDPILEIKSNYTLLEHCLKSCLNNEPPEKEMRIILNLMESVLNNDWEERTEPLILCWEYFHKRLNSSFYAARGNIGDIACVSKSASEMISHLSNKLESQALDKSYDAFHLYLRLLGHKLRGWQDISQGMRCWNQLKGRILSKFSPSKLAALNETGLYRFVLLFLTLALTTDVEEMGSKLQMYLKMLPVENLDAGRTKLVWKTHMAIILLHAELNRDITIVSTPLLDLVQVAVHQPDSIDLMRIFWEGFEDLIDCSRNLELGQYILIGNWMPQFLRHSPETDISRLLDSISSLMSKLNATVCAQLPMSQDNQLILLHNALWEHLVPYLKAATCNSSSPYQIPDIAALLTILSTNTCFASSSKMKAVDLFTFYIVHDSIDINTLCRYLGQISRSAHVHHFFSNNYILLIKGWLRCLLLTSFGDGALTEDISSYSNYVLTIPEINKLFVDTSVKLTPQSDYFDMFITAVQLKYSSISDLHSRNKFVNQLLSYFSNIDRWLSFSINSPKSLESVQNIYQNVGQMFLRIPQVMYIKSTPNTLLQCLLDLLLLPIQVRNPQFKLHSYVNEAIKKTLPLYVHGLFKLDPENDNYIARCIRELITIFVPRLVTPRNTVLIQGSTHILLKKCFERSDHFEPMSKAIVETVCTSFLKRRARVPHQFAYQALIFIHDIVMTFRTDSQVIRCIIDNAFERICDVSMFCDPTNPCKNEAREIIHFILNMDSLRIDQSLGGNVIEAFNKLCQEHLAFASHNLFEIFEDIVNVAPDLVYRALPLLNQRIEQVESKRGVGYDKALRNGLERVERALKNIRNE